MTQLTREAFEQALNKLATKDDIADLRTHVDASVVGVKNEIKDLRTEVNAKLDALLELLDVRNKVSKLQEDVRELQLQMRPR